MSNQFQGDSPSIESFTRRSVRSYWEDGLWDLASAGIFILLGWWGSVYVRFIAFPPQARPFLEEVGRDQAAWIGVAFLVIALAVYITISWYVVKLLKRLLVYPHTGLAEHRFFMPVDRKVFLWYFLLYLTGLAMLYGLFRLVKGGFSVLSVPIIISPAAISLVLGKIYNLRRYQWVAVVGFFLAVFLELSITTPASYLHGPHNFLDVLPQWGSTALPSCVWAVLFAISGLVGLIHARKGGCVDEP